MLTVQSTAYLLAACGMALVWKLVTRRMKQASLRNIPGPPSKSLWSGQSDCFCDVQPLRLTERRSGNMGEVHDPHGWKFHADIAAKFGRVVKINGILGVRTRTDEPLSAMLNFITGHLPLRQRYSCALSDTHQRSRCIRRTFNADRVRDFLLSVGELNRLLMRFSG